jgi:hypothetical protein
MLLYSRFSANTGVRLYIRRLMMNDEKEQETVEKKLKITYK